MGIASTLVSEAERSATFRTLLLTRARHTARLRLRLFPRPAPAALSPKQFDALRTHILRFRELIDEPPRSSASTTLPANETAKHAETA